MSQLTTLMVKEHMLVGTMRAAILEWTQVAQDGNARAQYNLGWMHANGRGIAQDFQEAIKWYTKSAEQGNVNAQYNLGNLYLRGQGLNAE